MSIGAIGLATPSVSQPSGSKVGHDAARGLEIGAGVGAAGGAGSVALLEMFAKAMSDAPDERVGLFKPASLALMGLGLLAGAGLGGGAGAGVGALVGKLS